MSGRRPDVFSTIRRAGGIACVALTAGCSGRQSALNPAGPQAHRILRLWQLHLGVAVVVYTVVMAPVIGAIVWHGRRRKTAPILAPAPATESRFTRSVVIGVALTTVTLLVLLAGDFATGRALHSLGGPDPLTIKVTGHQWWWDFQYQDPTPSMMVTTANEIHIPEGRTVRFELNSADVIHSFWIPNLHGKRDLIPGDPTHTTLRADRPGTFLGQCAEFCGYEHAFMRFTVVAEPEEAFRRWLDAQRQSAREPQTESQRRGRRVFLGSTCVMCHTIRRTPARSRVGPDLTHVGSRPMIGGVLPNARGHLAGWVVDPQSIKPGVRMPTNVVKPDDLDPLLDYLSSLK